MKAKTVLEDSSPYLNARNHGISLALTKKGNVETIFLYAEGHEGFSEFKGELPSGIRFGSSRKDVRSLMGEPMMAGEIGGEGVMANEFAFDRYETTERYMRFTYNKDESGILLITLAPA
jgi:hypothetical protein